jgi:UDP-2-acetamido-3-amino-2,3-dideoxy-glucuronate N-acetyltransferase
MHIAVVGCGQWGKNLVRNFHQLGVLGALCDENPSLEPMDSDAPFLSFADILANKNLKGVVIATPGKTHFELGLQALKAGKDVFIEKPMALHTHEMRILQEEAEKRSSILMVGHLMQYHPAFEALQAHVLSGALGHIQTIDAYRQAWGRVALAERNVLWSLAIHDLSLILSLMQDMPLSIQTIKVGHFSDADQIIVQMEFPRQRYARLFSSWICPYKDQRLVVLCEKGAISFNDLAPPSEKIKMYPQHFLTSPPYLTFQDSFFLDYPYAEPLRQECRHFLDCIRTRQAARTDAKEALQVGLVLEQIQQSLDRFGA